MMSAYFRQYGNIFELLSDIEIGVFLNT